MTAPVRIEGRAFGDARFAILGAGLKPSNRRLGLAAMAEVWSYATDRGGKDVLTDRELEAILGVPNGGDLLVEAELGERTPEGVKLRGAEGKLGWLEQSREAGRRGAEKRWGKARETTGGPNGDPSGVTNRGEMPSVSVSVSRSGSGSKTSSRTRAGTPEPSDDMVKLARGLSERIIANHPDGKHAAASPAAREATIRRWAMDIDKLYRIDNMGRGMIRDVIHWCQADPFWRANILSGKKLREKFDTLLAQMQRPISRPTRDSRYLTPDQIAARARELEENGE